MKKYLTLTTFLFIAVAIQIRFVFGASMTVDETMISKLQAMPSMQTWAWSAPARTIETSTGAVGWQISSTRLSTVSYNINSTTTATIGGNSGGYVTLELAPTNSATASDWVEMGRCGQSQNVTLALALQSVQSIACQLTTDVPVGYSVKLRSVTTSGSPSFGFISSNEVLK